MKYKVLIDYKNFIPIDEDELEKAVRAWAVGGKALFKRGATDRIQAVLPDYHAMMGWNYGYTLQAEDWQEIRNSDVAHNAEAALSSMKQALGLESPPRTPSIGREVKQIARKMSEPTFDT